jgi:hypothetical protein
MALALHVCQGSGQSSRHGGTAAVLVASRVARVAGARRLSRRAATASGLTFKVPDIA